MSRVSLRVVCGTTLPAWPLYAEYVDAIVVTLELEGLVTLAQIADVISCILEIV